MQIWIASREDHQDFKTTLNIEISIQVEILSRNFLKRNFFIGNFIGKRNEL